VRPPGYARPLPFDSLDHLVSAAAVDPDARRGLRVLENDPEHGLCNKAPQGEELPDEGGSDRLRKHYSHLV